MCIINDAKYKLVIGMDVLRKLGAIVNVAEKTVIVTNEAKQPYALRLVSKDKVRTSKQAAVFREWSKQHVDTTT